MPEGGAAQIVASSLSDVSFHYYDASGNKTAASGEVRRIGISISGASLLPDPQTGKVFGVQINSEIQVSA